MRVTNKGTVFNLFLVAMGFLLASATNATLGDWAEQPRHLPALRAAIDPTVAHTCTAEAAAYAAALEELDDAQAAADDAYAAWVQCEEEHMTPNISRDPGAQSVLIRE